MTPPTYEYPDEHARAVQDARSWAIAAIWATGMPAGLLWWATLAEFANPLVCAAATALFLVVTLAGMLGWYDTSRYVRIIPYFERHVGEIETFLAGESLARHFKGLERLAEAQGIPPLSEFGFNDDLCNQSLVWHNAERGLQAIRQLLNAVERASAPGVIPESLLADLRKLEHALSRAAAQQIRFCLLIRHGNTTSGHEWAVRKGTAF